ncbi:hypothetical protein O1611_g6997 [Lasiodiplodia mahajangana]|uniref:Uncharacterized protein n=1 Tax=Lasiodiplodia mahajangana TaxID=1108764 RepID=A0ACC2JH62_9PEZI|nr:hypothetical protein O1611_g6997 [Lasiodiplodia mahajangana]
MGHTKSYSMAAPVDDDFEFDESYFRQFYKPLSNLPTPPLSTRNSSANQSPRVSLDDTEGPNSQFLGSTSRPPREDATPRSLIHHPVHSRTPANASKSRSTHGHHRPGGLHSGLSGLQVLTQLAGIIPAQSTGPTSIETTHASLSPWAGHAHKFRISRDHHPSGASDCRQVRGGHAEPNAVLCLELGE